MRTARVALALLGALASLAGADAHAALVRLETTWGPVDLVVDERGAPLTAANFLARVRAKAYDGTFMHRLVPGVSLHAGAWTFAPLVALPATPTVPNEASPARPNVRGSVAMAKAPGSGASAPSGASAASAWFINLADNRATLDSADGGHAVFARLTAPSLALVDGVAWLPVVHAGPGFESLPLARLPCFAPIAPEHLLRVNAARELATTTASDADRVFNYLEALAPQYAWPRTQGTQAGGGYTYRHYPASGVYVGVRDGLVHYLVPSISGEIGVLGPLAEWLARAAAEGY